MSDIIPEGILYGNLGVGSGTTNYNDLDNKPQINSVTLQGNKTASELGLVGITDIPVTSVNGETGAVVLDGTEIEFSTGVSLNEKIIAVEQEIPVIAYPVTSVNGETGAVVLDGTDIEYSTGVSVNSQIDTLMNYIPVYGNTASGAIATFDTSLALPLQDLQIAINAVQESGTPTPSSPKAISGFTGANIVVCGGDNTLATYIKGIYQGIYGFVDLGSLTWTYDAESVPSNPYFFCQRDTVKVSTQNLLCSIYQLANVGVANMPDMSMKSNNKGQVLIINHNYTDAATFKTAMSGVYLIYELETPTTPTITQAQLTAICTSFNTSGTVYPITWQSEAGTVYGGSLDVTTGVLTVTWGSVDMGSLTWTYDSTYHRMKSNSIADMKKVNTARTLVFLCPIYQVISDGRSIANVPNDSIYASFDSDQKTAVWVHDSDYSDANVFKTAMSGIYIVYPLETPVTYQLTPTQISAIVGTNNVFTDTNGDTSVVYACSLKDYIDSQ